jgi:hypothetical protein
MVVKRKKSLNNNNNRYSDLSMAEFKGAVGAKIENIEQDLSEMRKNFTESTASNTLMLQGLTTNLAVLMSSGSTQAQQTSKQVGNMESRVMKIEEKEKERKAHSNRMAAVFGAIGGAILSFLTHFISTWLIKK